MEIRFANNSDKEAFFIYQSQITKESPYTIAIGQLSTETFDDLVEYQTLIIAIENNKVVGHIFFQIQNTHVNLASIAVLREYQGSGLADTLMVYFKKIVDETYKKSTISLYVDKTNKHAYNFYRKHEFIGHVSDLELEESSPNRFMTFKMKPEQISLEGMGHNPEKISIINGKRRRYRLDVLAITGRSILVNKQFTRISEYLPGGGLSISETIEQGAIREMMEETGWSAKCPYILSNDGTWLYKGDVFPGSTWDEEVQIAVKCKPEHYSPDMRFGDDEDQGHFHLVSIDSVITLHQQYIRNNGLRNEYNPRDMMIAKFRLQMLTMFGQPSFTRW